MKREREREYEREGERGSKGSRRGEEKRERERDVKFPGVASVVTLKGFSPECCRM